MTVLSLQIKSHNPGTVYRAVDVVLLSVCVCVSAEGQPCGEAGRCDVTRPQRVCAGDRL